MLYKLRFLRNIVHLPLMPIYYLLLQEDCCNVSFIPKQNFAFMAPGEDRPWNKDAHGACGFFNFNVPQALSDISGRAKRTTSSSGMGDRNTN